MKRLLSITLIALLLAPGGAAFGATKGAQDSDTEEIRRTFNLAPGAVVSVHNTNGRITITGWGQTHAEVYAVKRARRNREDLSRVSIDISHNPTRLDIRTIYERGRGNVEVEYELKVPAGVSIDSARSTSGDVSVSGVNGHTTAVSTSGNVTLRALGGNARAESTSGNIDGANIKGRVDASSTSGTIVLRDTGAASLRASSGDLTLVNAGAAELQTSSGNVTAERIRGNLVGGTASGNVRAIDITGNVKVGSMSGEVLVDRVTGAVNASSISGSVRITGGTDLIEAHSTSDDVIIRGARGRIEVGSTSGSVRLEEIESSQIDAETTSGDIHYTGALKGDGHYDFESLSGSVIVTVPPGCGFILQAKTFSGEIDTDFKITLQGLPQSSPGSHRRIEGISGQGCARLKASSFSGSVIIRNAETPRGQRRRDR